VNEATPPERIISYFFGTSDIHYNLKFAIYTHLEILETYTCMKYGKPWWWMPKNPQSLKRQQMNQTNKNKILYGAVVMSVGRILARGEGNSVFCHV